MKLVGIYRIHCIRDNKSYIGSSKDIKNRWKIHKYDLNNNKHSTPHLQAAWSLYGKQYFTFSILEECSEDNLYLRELYWQDLYDSRNREKGFNLLKPGEYPNNKGKKIKVSIERKVKEPETYLKIYQITQDETKLTTTKEVIESLGIKPNKLTEIMTYWRDYPQSKGLKSWHGHVFVREFEYNSSHPYTSLGNSNRIPWRGEKKTSDRKAYMKEYDKKRYQKMKNE